MRLLANTGNTICRVEKRLTNSRLPNRSSIVHSYNEHRILPHKIQEKTGVTAAVTPVSYPFEPVIAASKQLLYGVRPKAALFCFNDVSICLCKIHYLLCRLSAVDALHALGDMCLLFRKHASGSSSCIRLYLELAFRLVAPRDSHEA